MTHWVITAQLWSQSGVEINQSPQRTSLLTPCNRWRYRWYLRIFCLRISEKVNSKKLIFNRLTYLVHAKSIGELISFGFSDRSVRSLVSAKRSANR